MDFPVHIPFVEALGFELLSMDGGEAEIALPLQPTQTNSFGVAHGGATMTLLDVAMAHAARSVNTHTADFSPGVVTVEMKTSFMRPGQGRLLAKGRLLHRTGTLAFCEGSVWIDKNGEGGQLCAHATATFMYLRALPAGGRELRNLNAPPSADAPTSPFKGSGSD
jgi:uncharacterized protein (TIGR00369 family)